MSRSDIGIEWQNSKGIEIGWILSKALHELKYYAMYYVQSIIGQTKNGKCRGHEIEIWLIQDTYSRRWK